MHESLVGTPPAIPLLQRATTCAPASPRTPRIFQQQEVQNSAVSLVLLKETSNGLHL